MPFNSFGRRFQITTFGESHGPAIGVVIDGCPAKLAITKEEIDKELDKRRPGKSPYTSPREEKDTVEILSGVFEGETTGAPIALLIQNQGVDSSPYEKIKDLYRPGHANFTYLHKYGIFDYRGGGRSSARETAARVAAGAIAKKLLKTWNISCRAYVAEIGGIQVKKLDFTRKSPIFCFDKIAEKKILKLLKKIKEEGDSIGGIIACTATLPVGLGDPVYGKLEALLASAMLSIPASKGFEIGEGFQGAALKGSEHHSSLEVATRKAGGTLGGISTGYPLFFRVAFKPTSSIKIPQETLTIGKEKKVLTLPPNAKHDPCVAIRAVPIVEAMAALVFVDTFLLHQEAKLIDRGVLPFLPHT